MTCTFYIPSPPLNAFINHFYSPNNLTLYKREKILPMPRLDLKINFGGAFPVYMADQTQPLMLCTESWCVGLCSEYHIVDWPLDKHYIGVSFKPGGAYPFLRIPLSELHNQVVPLDAVWGCFAAEARERLCAAASLQERFALLERLLLRCLCEVPYGLNAVLYAVGEIVRHYGVLSIRELSDHMGMSQKHLISQFKRMTGATPKELARLHRFEHILYNVDPLQPVDWTQVAHQYFFYDQAHFNKDFEKFTGLTPSDYLHVRRQVHAENPEHARYVRVLPIG
jgi:AraC-like DNA-binding protein